MFNDKTQKAENGAVQIQAKNITLNEVSNIYNVCQNSVLQEYLLNAVDTAKERIGKLESQIMNLTDKVDGFLTAFGDPAFQFLLKDVQRSAASTEREYDYKILANLLAAHVQKGNKRITRAAIHRAVEIIPELDSQALCALTILCSMEIFTTHSVSAENCDDVFSRYNNLLKKLMYTELPSNRTWLEHLMLLDTVQINIAVWTEGFASYLARMFNGYSSVGIKKDSNNFSTAREIIIKASLPEELLVDNEFADGYVRLNIVDFNNLSNVIIRSEKEEKFISESEIKAIQQIHSLYEKNDELQEQIKIKLLEKWDSFEELKKFREWKESIDSGIYITSVGLILAWINAKNHESDLPDFIWEKN